MKLSIPDRHRTGQHDITLTPGACCRLWRPNPLTFFSSLSCSSIEIDESAVATTADGRADGQRIVAAPSLIMFDLPGLMVCLIGVRHSILNDKYCLCVSLLQGDSAITPTLLSRTLLCDPERMRFY